MRSSIAKSHRLLNDGTAPERHNAQLKVRCALCKSKSKRVTVKIVPTDSSRVFIPSYWYRGKTLLVTSYEFEVTSPESSLLIFS